MSLRVRLHVWTMAIGLGTICGFACSSSTVAPTASPSPVPAPAAPPQNGVVISGLENYKPFLVDDDHPTLIATRYVNGQSEDCTNTGRWRSSNTNVAWFASSPRSRLSVSAEGKSTEISVTCGDMVGTATVTTGRWQLELQILDSVTRQPVGG